MGKGESFSGLCPGKETAGIIRECNPADAKQGKEKLDDILIGIAQNALFDAQDRRPV